MKSRQLIILIINFKTQFFRNFVIIHFRNAKSKKLPKKFKEIKLKSKNLAKNKIGKNQIGNS